MTRSRMVRGILFLLLFAAGVRAAEPDGPYILRRDGGLANWSVVIMDGAAQKQVRAVAENSVVTVPAVGRLPPFSVKLRPPAAPLPDAVLVAPGNPIFVVADTHGEFELLGEMLQKHAVVDSKLAWSFGRGHLIVLGDVLDRGPNHTEILWLLYELESQARKAGGGVHLVLGNHEAMVLQGDSRYLNPKYAQTARVFGMEYGSLFGPDSVLGQWLRARSVALRVNDMLVLHGGISRALLDQGIALADMNSTVRATLDDRIEKEQDLERAEFLLGPLGPLWYRGYFAAPDDFMGASAADIDLTQGHFGVKRILVGHTAVPTIKSLYDGRVIAVQVYPKRGEAGQVSFECLLIRDGQLLRAKFDGGTEPLL